MFERGMVVVKGVITKDVTWPEVSEVIVNKAPSDGMLEGATLAYVLRCGNGKKVAIEGGDENDRVGPQLTRLLSNAGFVVAPGHVATCAHVVSAALAADPSDPRAPAGEVALDFPFAGLPVVRARVKRWQPIVADGTGDIAILTFPPTSCCRCRCRCIRPSSCGGIGSRCGDSRTASRPGRGVPGS